MRFSNFTISKKGFFVPSYEVHQDDELVYTLHRPSFFKFTEMHLYDVNGNFIMLILRHRKFASYLFDLIEEGRVTGQVRKGGFTRHLTAESTYGNYDINTEGMHSSYTFKRGGVQEVARVSRKRFKRTKCYGISIKEGENEVYIIGVVLVIALIHQLRKNKN